MEDSDLIDSKDSGSGTKGTAKGKLEIPLPVFTGKRLHLYARDFLRYLRMTGQKAADEMTCADLIVTGCKNEWLRGVVDDMLTTSESWVHFLKQLESAFPHFETDASARSLGESAATQRTPNSRRCLSITAEAQKPYDPVEDSYVRDGETPVADAKDPEEDLDRMSVARGKEGEDAHLPRLGQFA